MARVMVVDDDAGIASALAMGLGMAGHEVCVAADAAAAIERLRTSALPDVMVVDLLMPGRSGKEMIEEMAADPELRGIAVIIATATAGQGSFPRPGTYRGVLRKPFELADVLDAVDRGLHGGGAAAGARRA